MQTNNLATQETVSSNSQNKPQTSKSFGENQPKTLTIIDVAQMHVEDNREQVFTWGENDCVLWVCDYLKKIHGFDYAEEFRGKYRCELGARKLCRELGYDNLEDAISSVLSEKSIRFAARGDVIMTYSGAVGICLGYYSYFLGITGIMSIKTKDCKLCWSVK